MENNKMTREKEKDYCHSIRRAVVYLFLKVLFTLFETDSFLLFSVFFFLTYRLITLPDRNVVVMYSVPDSKGPLP